MSDPEDANRRFHTDLREMPKDKNARKEWFAERKKEREQRFFERLRLLDRASAEAYEAENGIDTWEGDKWWEREMTSEELLEYRAEREMIERKRFAGLVEEERKRYGRAEDPRSDC